MNTYLQKINPKARTPKRSTDSSIGHDVFACLDESIVLESGSRSLIPTGFRMAMPKSNDGFLLECQVRPRSGLSLREGISVANSPGTIDPDYRGEVKIILENRGEFPFAVHDGDRIAQLVFNYIPIIEFMEVDNLDATERGESGFGSTGV